MSDVFLTKHAIDKALRYGIANPEVTLPALLLNAQPSRANIRTAHLRDSKNTKYYSDNKYKYVVRPLLKGILLITLWKRNVNKSRHLTRKFKDKWK